MASETNFSSILIYCDGACSGNPGPGGWAAIVAEPSGHVRELGGHERETTNNQMEMRAALEALISIRELKNDVVIYTDSVYVIRGITQWIFGWSKRGWKTADGKDVSNKDLWERLAHVVNARRTFNSHTEWKYVRGHRGVAGNERCDEIAVQFSQNRSVMLFDGSLLNYGHAIYDLPADEGLPDPMRDRPAKAPAHSYLSALGGVVMRHSNWADCERRVKGQPGAKFKKAISAGNEIEIVKSWGLDPNRISNADSSKVK